MAVIVFRTKKFETAPPLHIRLPRRVVICVIFPMHGFSFLPCLILPVLVLARPKAGLSFPHAAYPVSIVTLVLLNASAPNLISHRNAVQLF